MAAPLPIILLVGAATFVASAFASRAALIVLRRLRILDEPNQRSSHRLPMPRGGGIGFMIVILIAFALAMTTEAEAVTLGVMLGALAIVAISFADDLRPMPWSLRLLVQAGAIALALITLPGNTPILAAGLPVWLDRLLVGLSWLWFVNLFNFMDGIDGIAGGEAAIIALGVAVVALFHPSLDLAVIEASVLGAAALGFLTLNWSPAKLFMGDVGSTGLGFLLGWLLIDTAAKGLWAAAIILPAFFLVDATSTVVARAIRGRRIWIAHRDHAYQAGVDRGLSHRAVTGLVLALGVALIALAVVSVDAPILGLSAGLLLACGLVAWLRWGASRPQPIVPPISGTSSR